MTERTILSALGAVTARASKTSIRDLTNGTWVLAVTDERAEVGMVVARHDDLAITLDPHSHSVDGVVQTSVRSIYANHYDESADFYRIEPNRLVSKPSLLRSLVLRSQGTVVETAPALRDILVITASAVPLTFDHTGERVVIESPHEAHLATITETVESSWTTLTDAPEIGADLIATYLDTDEYRQPVTRQSMFPSGVYAVRAA